MYVTTSCNLLYVLKKVNERRRGGREDGGGGGRGEGGEVGGGRLVGQYIGYLYIIKR